MRSIVIIGAGGHGKVVADIVERQGRYSIAGWVDSGREPGERHAGYAVLGPVEEIAELVSRYPVAGALVALGDNASRLAMVQRLVREIPDLRFITAVHPTAAVGRGASLGPGTVVMAQAVVNPDAVVGAHCILNTGSSLDHDSRMDDFASLAPGAAVGGNARIGTGAAVSIGVSVLHGVGVGEHTVVGAGAVVVGDLPGHCVALGVPARMVRTRGENEPYL